MGINNMPCGIGISLHIKKLRPGSQLAIAFSKRLNNKRLTGPTGSIE